MDLLEQPAHAGMHVSLIRGLGRERDDAERELLEAGVSLPLAHRAIWAANLYRSEPLFLVIRDESGRPCAGFAIEQVKPRSMPGHRILRVVKFGGNLPSEACQVGARALRDFATNTPNVLWLQLQVFSKDGRAGIAEALEESGFREVSPPSIYRNTLVVDLKKSEDEIFASLSPNGRRRIREAIKKSLRSHVITDQKYAKQLTALQQAAFQRTGGRNGTENWPGILKMSLERPDVSRVVGLFEDDDRSPEQMRAFLWGCNNGDHWEYRAAGSIRRSETPIPFGYLLAWEMILWAKAKGAEWFDMGGVTMAENDPLTGISRFKRCFSHEIAEVGAEWAFEPSATRALIAKSIASGTQYVMGRIFKRR